MAVLPATGLAVRWLHLLGVAVLFGGTTLVWWLVRRGVADPVASARGYEYLFWLAAGAVVLTGVGNAGALAPAVPGPGTAWGRTLTAKLLAVAGLLVLSAVRTLVVVLAAPDDGAATGGARTHRGVRTAYAATGWYLAGLLALGEVLAHG